MDLSKRDELVEEADSLRFRARRQQLLLMALEGYEAETKYRLDRRLWAEVYQGA